eukprot:jgi/Psemu1/300742/fgenesh1_kg.18_\
MERRNQRVPYTEMNGEWVSTDRKNYWWLGGWAGEQFTPFVSRTWRPRGYGSGRVKAVGQWIIV